MGNTASAAGTGRYSAALVASLRELISSLSPGEYLPSVRQLAAEHGLATNTVQRALRKLAAGRLIVAEPRQGYRVLPPQARAGRAAPLACVLEAPDRGGIWDQKLVGLFERAAAGRGRSLLAVDGGNLSPEEVVEQLRAARARGVLLASSEPALLEAIAESGIPAVMVDAWSPGAPLDAVVQDGFAGAMLAAAHLVERGHGRIAWLGPETAGADPQILERFAGAVAGLASAGIELSPELRVEPPAGSDAAMRRAYRERAIELLAGTEPPTGFLTLWGSPAAGLLDAAGELGLAAGRDFELVGWSTEENYAPGFTSMFGGGPVAPAITWEVALMAETAIRRLEERRAEPGLPVLQIKISTTLKLPKRGDR